MFKQFICVYQRELITFYNICDFAIRIFSMFSIFPSGDLAYGCTNTHVQGFVMHSSVLQPKIDNQMNIC